MRSFSQSLRCLIGLLALVAMGAAACSADPAREASVDIDLQLRRGEAYLNGILRAAGNDLSEEDLIALAYSERVRLGIGSPFRTIEYATRDPDLSPSTRQLVAYGLLARAEEGRTYVIDPQVFDVAPMFGVTDRDATGEQQLELIEQTIATAQDATIGERSVRLGYLLATAERTIPDQQESVFNYAAALVADRRRATEDAHLLLRTARSAHRDPLTLLVEWRRSLRFAVEQPRNGTFTVRGEEAEAAAGPRLALALRTLAQRESAGSGGQRRRRNSWEPTRIDSVSASRLEALVRERNYPAQAPIAVASTVNREAFLSPDRLAPDRIAVREHFLDSASSEEGLISAIATLAARGEYRGIRPRLIVLQSAVFMRGWNQEEPWFPGDAGPSVRDLQTRFGLGTIAFDEDVPSEWQPFYMRMVGRALTDLQKTLPTASWTGLNIQFGSLPTQPNALALHDPGSRTLYLPPTSGAGTLAHEFAHDLDWQLTTRRYGQRRGYATDLAVRDLKGDRIATALLDLSASLTRSSQAEDTDHQRRPAEVFARGADWLVATLLAQQGISGGYLSSFQDDVLRGYGTTRAPDLSGSAVPAIISLLNGIAPVDATQKGSVVTRFGPNRSLRGVELSRAIIGAGAGLPADERFLKIRDVATRSATTLATCPYGSADANQRMINARRQLTEWTLNAALRGAAIDAVRELAREEGDRALEPVVEEWLAWQLFGAPEPIDSRLDDLVPAFEIILLNGELARPRERAPLLIDAFHLVRAPSLCGNPFAATPTTGLIGN